MTTVRRVLITSILTLSCFTSAQAAWIWTPETGRWINPKYAAKDSPKAQMEWAMSFFEQKEYPRAAKEFYRLVRAYPRSELAPEAQYLLGVSYEKMDRPGNAFAAYKKLVEVYPFSERFKEGIEREYLLGKAFAEGKKVEWVGPIKFTSKEKAIEVFQHVVDHAPYGSYGDQAQFEMGEVLLSTDRWEEAQRAFQRVLDSYPGSPLTEQAKFKIATCADRLSRDPSYDQSATNDAMQWYKTFVEEHPDSEQAADAEESLKRLREIKAQRLIEIGQFYEKQRKPKAALVYYREALEQYPDTAAAAQALAKVTELERSGGSKK